MSPARFLRLLVACLLLVTTGLGSGQAERPWQADWLGVPLEKKYSPRNQWLCFRGEVEFAAQPESARARLAVDSRYWLWINGQRAVYEGGLKRGPTPEDTYYDELELAPWLHEGTNTIAVLVWHFGKQGFSHKNSGRAGLCFELEGARGSDAEWRALVHPAYGMAEPFEPYPNYRLAESDVRYDARLALADWTQPGFDDSDWPHALELGEPPCAPWNRLVRRPTPQLRDLGLRDYLGGELEPLEDGSRRIRCRLPYNATVHPWLRVRAAAGLSIDVRTDNYEGGGERNLRHQYITRAGEQEYECLGYLNGTEVHYLLPAGVEWLDLKYRETRYDSEVVGDFECEDPFLLALRQKALQTLPLNMRDGIQDPDRERAQWWGDVVNVIPQIFVSYDARAHLLVAKAIRNLFDWQRADGSLFSPVPSGSWDKELPLQMLASVGEYGLARYVLLSGDLELLREVYARALRYLDLWTLDEDGLVVQRPGEWAWIDWGQDKDVSLLYDAWYHLALQGLARMAGWMQDAPRARATGALLERHAAAFRARYWRGDGFRSPEYQGASDDRGNALAVLAGLSRPEEAAALEALLSKERHASPYMERYVLEALFELGDGSSALKRMRGRYLPMVRDPAPTLWERWDLDPAHSSYNHAWSGSPLHLLPEFVAGILPLEAGYRRYRVRPRLGPLNSVRATVPTVSGEIRLRIERQQPCVELELDSPEGTIALVELPAASDGPWRRLFVDGELRWQAAPDDLTPAPSVELSAGHHRLRAER